MPKEAIKCGEWWLFVTVLACGLLGGLFAYYQVRDGPFATTTCILISVIPDGSGQAMTWSYTVNNITYSYTEACATSNPCQSINSTKTCHYAINSPNIERDGYFFDGAAFFLFATPVAVIGLFGIAFFVWSIWSNCVSLHKTGHILATTYTCLHCIPVIQTESHCKECPSEYVPERFKTRVPDYVPIEKPYVSPSESLPTVRDMVQILDPKIPELVIIDPPVEESFWCHLESKRSQNETNPSSTNATPSHLRNGSRWSVRVSSDDEKSV